MTAEFEFLTAACRAWLGTGDTPVPIPPHLDPAALEELADIHGLEPLLFDLIEQSAIPEPVPPDLRNRWETAYLQNHVFNTEALEVLDRLNAACRQDGVAIAVFKGPATLARAYRDPALRVMVDIDLFCREADLGRLTRLAADQGFVDARATMVHHLTLVHHELALALEPHFTLYGFLPQEESLFDGLLSRAEFAAIAGCRFPALAPADAWVLDVAHLVNHDFTVGLRHLLDFAATARFAPPLEKSVIVDRSVRFGLFPELELAAALVERLFDVAVPQVSASPLAEVMPEVDRLEEGLRRGGHRHHRRALHEVTTLPGLAGRLRFAARRLFPSPAQIAALSVAKRTQSRARQRLRHFGWALRRPVGNLRRFGAAPPTGPESSIKRRVYERRRAEKG